MKRAGSALAVLGLLAHAPAAAQPASPSTVYEQRVESAWNRHRRGGADSRRTDARIVVVRAADGRLRAFESGVDRDFAMHQTPRGAETREELRRWLTRWTGTWRPDGADAHLVLTRVADACTVEVSHDRRPPKREACRPRADVAHLRCVAWRGEDDDLPGVRGWRCAAEGPSGLAGLPWYLADRCVRVSRGPGARSRLGQCPPPPGPPTP